jgi:hypothetical protein
MIRHRTVSAPLGGAAAVALMFALASAGTLRAQSNMSVQGFGFPTGQISARAYGAGGSTAETDPLSPLNPASIGQIGSRIVFFQIEPEYRTVTTDSGSERTTTARYPVVFGALPISSRVVMSLGSSTLLDRTATTVFNTTQAITPTELVPMTTRYRVDGAINDIRLAAAWNAASWLRLGAGLHGIAGHNLVSITQSFTDTTQFASFTQQRVLSFGGAAGSAGVQLYSKSWMLAGSFRAGGKLDLSSSDTVLGSGRVPTRFGASLSYTGLANSSFSVRTSHDNW